MESPTVRNPKMLIIPRQGKLANEKTHVFIYRLDSHDSHDQVHYHFAFFPCDRRHSHPAKSITLWRNSLRFVEVRWSRNSLRKSRFFWKIVENCWVCKEAENTCEKFTIATRADHHRENQIQNLEHREVVGRLYRS